MIAYEHVKNIKLNPDILERNIKDKPKRRLSYGKKELKFEDTVARGRVYGILFRYIYLSSGDLTTGGQGVICSSGL